MLLFLDGCPASGQSLIPYPNVCNKFIECNNGRKVVHVCFEGLYWNPETEYCDSPTNVNCYEPQGEPEPELELEPELESEMDPELELEKELEPEPELQPESEPEKSFNTKFLFIKLLVSIS